jgi:DNA-directed RNA polymerase subunit RPC12/RpoP
MMAFNCPRCRKTFEVKVEFAGRKTKCPQCGTALLVPGSAAPVSTQPAHAAEPTSSFCSNCGAVLQAGARFCSSCGAPSGQTPALKQAVPAIGRTVKCPVCRADNPPNPTNCDRCKLQIGNIVVLRAMQQNVLAEQRRVRNEVSRECQRALDPHEFICYMAPAERGSKIYVVTERRILTFKNVGWLNAKFVPDSSLGFSEITSFSDGRFLSEGPTSGRLSHVVHTNNSDVEYWFDTSLVSTGENEQSEGHRWFFRFREAYQSFMGGSTVIGALLMRANL